MTMNLQKWVLALGFGGVLFAGYLSGVKFFTNTCAFGEGCPYFLGYPACYYGFAMFSVIFVFSALRVLRKVSLRTANEIILITTVLGTLFAGYFTLTELPVLFSDGFGAFMLGLPTCALGLIFYIIIFVLEFKQRTR